MKLIIARYEEIGNKRRLRMVGPFSREVVDSVILKSSPYTCGPEEGRPGQASFLVGSESECPLIIGKLTQRLKEHDYKADYRGCISVLPEELLSLKRADDLPKLVNRTLVRESRGEINPGNLVALDYKAELERLRKIK